MSARTSVKILNPSLDQIGDEIVIRGILSCDSYDLIKVGKYQREVMGGRAPLELQKASIKGLLPDLDLGMRGEAFTVSKGDTHIYLKNDVYVIDGLQRINAGKEVIAGGKDPRIGVVVRLNSTAKKERDRFEVLNATQRKVSPNILLRNLAPTNRGIEMLHNLYKDKSFILHNRIAWNQNSKTGELITARSYASISIQVHFRFSNHSGRGNYDVIADVINRTTTKLGYNTTRANVFTFFSIVDEVWNIKSIEIKEGAIFMRLGFLSALAMFFARHSVFWKGEKLQVDRPTKAKLGTFPLFDSYIKELSSGGEAGTHGLYMYMIEHVNKGKKTRRLVADI